MYIRLNMLYYILFKAIFCGLHTIFCGLHQKQRGCENSVFNLTDSVYAMQGLILYEFMWSLKLTFDDGQVRL